jgi:hypothetical protein
VREFLQEFFQSSSLGSASVLVAIFSAIVALPVSFFPWRVIRWCVVILFPFALAYCVYWTPVWLGSDDVAQYDAWEMIGVGGPFVAGLVISILLTLIITELRKRHA